MEAIDHRLADGTRYRRVGIGDGRTDGIVRLEFSDDENKNETQVGTYEKYEGSVQRVVCDCQWHAGVDQRLILIEKRGNIHQENIVGRNSCRHRKSSIGLNDQLENRPEDFGPADRLNSLTVLAVTFVGSIG